ncbi:hypothetical protein [Polyangium jinanense]|uniref:Uncharacterized protein n=1 Tax=Polyangium jinanense TaxID=2829994 RepID=A0A9X4AVA7_9BACT|nr:hypothetical protein [Polyangium jinanense]MDC3959480.1 hypothetical protein [Polyangium jinanense]MDC3986078.1 hypothetical protein [Polyangium jinanense]
MLSACTSAQAPPDPQKELAASTASAVAPPPSPAAPIADGGAADAEAPPADASAGDAATAAISDAGSDAAEVAAPYVADNKVLPPLDSEELQKRAAALFNAIVADDPARGESFWFPKEPFIPLKDVKGADKYWDQLHRTYARDIHALHKKRKSWEGATFEKFELGSTPKWVPPGDEGNKIGYYRTFRGKLRYRIGEQTQSIEVRVIISWQGRWYITHLSKFKK